MRDIKKRSTSLRSNTHFSPQAKKLDDLKSSRGSIAHGDIPPKRHNIDIDKKFENFEKSAKPLHKNNQHRRSTDIDFFSKKNKIIFSLFILLLIVLFLITFVFNHATVVITPRIEKFTGRESLVITNNLQKNFEVSELNDADSKTLPKSESKSVESKAGGSVTIYNNYSESPQKLIKNTRFETVDGKIFRVGSSVVVPGKTSNGPGSIKAEVSADSVGSQYNIAPTKFTIPGFKNTARYDAFYAESKDYMKGGSSGNVDAVAVEDIDKARDDLENKLKNNLESEAVLVKKDGFFGVFKSITYDVIDNRDDLLVGITNDYKISVNAKVLFVRESAIANSLAYKQIPNFNGEKVRLKDFNNINILLNNDSGLFATSSVSISVEGDNYLIYEIDQNDLKKDMATRSKNDFVDILKPYKEQIYSAKSSIFPSWLQKFPANINKIKIEESLQ